LVALGRGDDCFRAPAAVIDRIIVTTIAVLALAQASGGIILG
jgi:hypothetical protein